MQTIMNSKKLENSPIWYYISENKREDAVLFIHAAFSNHTQYDKQIDEFSKYFKVITIDLIGHGKSTVTKKGDNITITSYWIKKILDKENIKKIHIVGISLGAVIAEDFANHYPNMMKSLSCFGAYNINNFNLKMQKSNQIAQMIMILKALFSIKWFAKK